MDLQINSNSHVPVHLQLEQQIKHLILTGGFEVGSRLPSTRAMAGYLRINRNTVARVFSDLEREGFVESRRGSGMYVLEPPVDAVEMKEEVLDRVMDLAAARGLPVEDLAYALLARAGAAPREKTKILFVECTREALDQFSGELEGQLPVDVERVLLEDLPGRLAENGEPPWALAVTTFFHVHEVQDLMGPLGVETVALLAEANIESLRRLTELPARTPVGVVGWGQTCMENLSRSIEGAGLDHLQFVSIYIDEETDEVLETLEKIEAVVCASITARKLREVGVPKGLEIIEEDRILDQGGIEMLGRMLRQLPETTRGTE
ncbi:MAG: Predicted transcriptional regulator of N-Acetylglucosamine utilization, GntR family [uncultured Rubrobacteraceae bacterium]|uniref:Predicted transcriptional regulator of N-Acetylglucosamine utilization, GntR family n=1 Tax=uncultured Rubrobacteraceae bacterium TaxID=349277 RepID=A0A6J4P1Y0_9ACTN|nr:MAG: Predicted transcriptional regulator of N-Acetylglucosamine utilization, GntR family [uncultured Rubrobacteraceae bacterium]